MGLGEADFSSADKAAIDDYTAGSGAVGEGFYVDPETLNWY